MRWGGNGLIFNGLNRKTMTEEGKDKIITRAIHFITTNSKDDSYRIGQAIIAELELVKKLTIPIVSNQRELLIAYENKVGHSSKLDAEIFVDKYLNDFGN